MHFSIDRAERAHSRLEHHFKALIPHTDRELSYTLLVSKSKISKYRQPESNRHECYHSTDFKSVASTNSAMAAYLESISSTSRLARDGCTLGTLFDFVNGSLQGFDLFCIHLRFGHELHQKINTLFGAHITENFRSFHHTPDIHRINLRQNN